jgi:prepilin-type N-terminal cleavage/methylation domain-containing protein
MNNQGASLIEVLVAMVLLAIGLLGAVGFSRVGNQALSYGDQIAKVSALAQAKMEDKFGLPYDDFISKNPESDLTQDGIQLTWKIKRDDPFIDIATIEIIAQWTDGKGKKRRISFVGIKSNPVMPGDAPPEM